MLTFDNTAWFFFRYKMLHIRVLALSVYVFVALQTQLCVSIDSEEDDGDDRPGSITELIFQRISMLQGQARPDQFAALVLLNQREVNNPNLFQFHPQNPDGSPIVNNNLSFSPESPQNYVATRPNTLNWRTDNEVQYHAEEIALQQLPGMWNRFVDQGQGPPAMILLFTRLYPCTPNTGRTGRRSRTRNCTETIRSVLYQQQPYNSVDRIIAYNDNDDHSRVRDLLQQNSQFRSEGFTIMALAMAACLPPRSRGRRSLPSGTCQVPSAVQTMQGCIHQYLSNENLIDDMLTCVKTSAASKQKAYLINKLIDKCLLNQNMETCVKDEFLEATGSACPLRKKQSIADKLSRWFQQCSLKPVSKPQQNPSNFNDAATLMTSHRQKRSYSEPTASCSDNRRTGLLCTHLDDRYLTAGNSLCREDHPCGYHDKNYYWCYTSWDNHWEYCCSRPCGYNGGSSYLWCHAGNTYEYCGKGGSVTVNGRQCLADHPCGLHRDSTTKYQYYWCYTDTKSNWEYCCSPEPDYNTCDYHKGTTYKWCKSNYYKTQTSGETAWQYCNY